MGTTLRGYCIVLNPQIARFVCEFHVGRGGSLRATLADPRAFDSRMSKNMLTAAQKRFAAVLHIPSQQLD
jgi:hypothetical protein